MIIPRLFRRSLVQAMQRRLLLLWWASLLVPGAIAALPVFRFLGAHLDHSPRARQVVAFLDGPTLLDLLRQLEDSGNAAAVGLGLGSAVLALLFVSPFMAGAMVAAARSDEPLPLRRLLAGAGELYGRMLRTFLWGLIPLGIGAAITAGAFKLASRAAERALTEGAANGRWRTAVAISAAVLFLCHLLVDAARAQFAAQPARRSGLLALWSALRLLLRRPLRMLAVGALGTAVGLGGALVLMALRLRIDQGGSIRIGIAWILAQAAHVAIGWGRGTRIFGLAELARTDAADRERPFRLEPPTTSPPPAVVQSATLSALSAQDADLSSKDASGT